MAKVRIGFSTHFEVENEPVGIGTDSALDTLHVTGDITSHNIDAGGGITTVTTYSGFVDKKVILTNPDINLNSKVHSLSGEIIVEGDITVSSGTTITSGPENLTVTDNFTLPGISDDKPTAGTMRFNKNLASLEFYTGVEWRAVNSFTDISNSSGGSRGYIAGGYDGSDQVKTIDLIRISTLGNAVNFGDNSSGSGMRQNNGSASSRTRGFRFSSGSDATILYFTLSTTGRAEDFGESTFSGSSTAVASSTRAIAAIGSYAKTLDYIEMATKSNALDFADLFHGRTEYASVSSETRGVFCGGGAPSGSNPKDEMDVIIIASKANATDFGNLTDRRGQLGGGVSDGVRGAVSGGTHHPKYLKSIDYITFASNGDAIHFGDLTTGRVEQAGATCNRVRGLFCGGSIVAGTTQTNSIEFITITSTGNGQDFGDLVKKRDRIGGGCISDSHGGLGGF